MRLRDSSLRRPVRPPPSRFCKVRAMPLGTVASQNGRRDTPHKEARPVALNLPPAARPEIALHEQLEETDRGLVYDLSTLIDRRQVLKLAGLTTISAGLMSIVTWPPGATGAPSSASATASAAGPNA